MQIFVSKCDGPARSAAGAIVALVAFVAFVAFVPFVTMATSAAAAMLDRAGRVLTYAEPGGADVCSDTDRSGPLEHCE
jgi:hypothetical protein